MPAGAESARLPAVKVPPVRNRLPVAEVRLTLLLPAFRLPVSVRVPFEKKLSLVLARAVTAPTLRVPLLAVDEKLPAVLVPLTVTAEAEETRFTSPLIVLLSTAVVIMLLLFMKLIPPTAVPFTLAVVMVVLLACVMLPADFTMKLVGATIWPRLNGVVMRLLILATLALTRESAGVLT